MKHDHQYYMKQCLALAKTALDSGNPPVGALIVLNGEIIGEGIESGRSTGDITNHAEIMAIRDALKNGHSKNLNYSSMYTTHEPCIMCSYMIRHHRISKIVYGSAVPFVGGSSSQFKLLETEDVPKWANKPEIISDICLDECNALTAQFLGSLNKQ